MSQGQSTGYTCPSISRPVGVGNGNSSKVTRRDDQQIALRDDRGQDCGIMYRRRPLERRPGKYGVPCSLTCVCLRIPRRQTMTGAVPPTRYACAFASPPRPLAPPNWPDSIVRAPKGEGRLARRLVGGLCRWEVLCAILPSGCCQTERRGRQG